MKKDRRMVLVICDNVIVHTFDNFPKKEPLEIITYAPKSLWGVYKLMSSKEFRDTTKGLERRKEGEDAP